MINPEAQEGWKAVALQERERMLGYRAKLASEKGTALKLGAWLLGSLALNVLLTLAQVLTWVS